MKRNIRLTTIRIFKHKDHFYDHLSALLKLLYPNALIEKHTITFREAPYMGLSFKFHESAIDPQISKYFRELYPKFKRNGFEKFDLVNTGFQWTGSSGKGYMYPLDRNMFDDSKLGMEQKTVFVFFILL